MIYVWIGLERAHESLIYFCFQFPFCCPFFVKMVLVPPRAKHFEMSS